MCEPVKTESEFEKLKKALFMEPKNLGITLGEDELKKAEAFCEGYKKFLDNGKTEREAVKAAVAIAEKSGFKPMDRAKKYKAGDKFYQNNRGKAIILPRLF